MSVKLKDFFVRAVSAAVFAVIVLGAIWGSYLTFGALLLVITLISVYEFFNMTKVKGVSPQQILGFAVAAAIFAFGFDSFYNEAQNTLLIVLFLILMVPSIFMMELFKGGVNPFENIGLTLLPMLYIATPMSMLVGVPLLLADGVWNPMVMMCYLFVIWANDSFAYLVGVSFGRHRLYEAISSKKSWEGFFGGIAGSVAIALAVAYYLDSSVAMWVGVALITSIIGSVGDLVESMFKRACGIKDSGRLMPGHGGCLDRFDSMIFSAPFVFVYLILLS